MTGMVKLAGLTARVYKFGTEYLVGHLGDVKVVVCENRERTGDDDASHCIYLAPVTQQEAPQPAPQPPKPAPRKAPPKRMAPKRDTRKPQPVAAFSGDWQRPLPRTPGEEPSSRPDWDGMEDRLTI
jgi:hypothetical protein